MKKLKRTKKSTHQDMFTNATKLVSTTNKVIQLLIPLQDGAPNAQECYAITKYINKMNIFSDIILASASKTKSKTKSKKSSKLPAQITGPVTATQHKRETKAISNKVRSPEKPTKVKKRKLVAVDNKPDSCKLRKITVPVSPDVILLDDHVIQKSVISSDNGTRTHELVILDDEDPVVVSPPKITKKSKKRTPLSTINEKEKSVRTSDNTESELSMISHSSSQPNVILIEEDIVKKISAVENISQFTISKSKLQVGRPSKMPSPKTVCKYCLQAFSSDLALHKKTCRTNAATDLCTVDLSEEMSDHPCACCSIVLRSSHNLRLHLNAVHNRKIPVCTCHGCKKNFTSFVKLDSHLSKIRQEKCFVECASCNTKFKSAIKLRYHVKVKHLKKSGVECPVCNKRFGGKKDLAIHMADMHTDVRAYKCPKCEKDFGHESRLKDHLKYSKCSGKLFPCTICEKSYQARSSLARHLKFIHKLGMQDVNNNSLTVNSTDGDAAANLQDDELSIIPTPDKAQIRAHLAIVPVPCPTGTIDMTSEPQDVVKKREIKLKTTIEGVCKFCLKHFPTVTLLSKHKKVCWPNFTSDLCTLDLIEVKGQHVCPCCSRHVPLSSSHALRNHFNTCHSTRFPVCTCHCCNKNFTTFSKLNKHISKSEKCYLECKTCYQQYRSISTLRGHVSVKHHGKGGLSCSICNKVFTIKTNLDIHMSRMHKEARPYKCIKCQSGFSHPALVTRHMSRSKCSEKIFSCEICGKGFHAYTSWHKHLKQMHKLNMRQYKAYLKGRDVISI